jgi:hypothetical protein
MTPLTNETAKWSVLTYKQQYIDDDDENVFYQGTLFVQLSKVSLEGCDLKLSVHVQDRFTGTISKQQALHLKTADLGQQSETFNYEYLLNLTDLRQLEGQVLLGRPVQIPAHTGYICEEQPSCELTWLDVKLPAPLIKEAGRETASSTLILNTFRSIFQNSLPPPQHTYKEELEQY